MKERLCVNCKHYRLRYNHYGESLGPETAMCMVSGPVYKSPVSPKLDIIHNPINCTVMRQIDGKCGIQGRLWENTNFISRFFNNFI